MCHWSYWAFHFSLGIFLHSLKCPFKVFKMVLQTSRPKPHTSWGFTISMPVTHHSDMLSPSILYPEKPLQSQLLLSHGFLSFPKSQPSTGRREEDTSWALNPFYFLLKMAKSGDTSSRFVFYPGLDYFSCVNQQKWAVMGDLNSMLTLSHNKLKEMMEMSVF